MGENAAIWRGIPSKQVIIKTHGFHLVTKENETGKNNTNHTGSLWLKSNGTHWVRVCSPLQTNLKLSDITGSKSIENLYYLKRALDHVFACTLWDLPLNACLLLSHPIKCDAKQERVEFFLFPLLSRRKEDTFRKVFPFMANEPWEIEWPIRLAGSLLHHLFK